MIVATTSISGSPGVTSWTLILAAAWDAALSSFEVGTRCIVECDPDGGVFGSRYGIGVNPGVASLVASCRREQQIEPLDHGRQIADSVVVVPSSESAEACESILQTGAASLAEILRLDRHLWFVDVGRLSASASTTPLIDAAAVTVLFTRAERDSLIKVPTRVAALRQHGTGVAVVIVGNPAYSPSELRDFFASDLVLLVPEIAGLPKLAAQLADGGRVRRQPAWKAALAAIPPLVDLISVSTNPRRNQSLKGAAS